LQPKIVVISDALPIVISWIRFHLPNTKIVNTRHGIGIGGKNYGLYAAAATDYICVTSKTLKQDLCRDAMLDENQVWVTGFSQMDGLFRFSSTLNKQSNLPRVTFAPTADPKLSAIDLIGDNPIRWIRGNNKNIHLTIRPHPNLFLHANRLMNAWKEIIRNEPNVVMDDDPFSDPSELLINTDLLISDVSSLAMQFMTLNKPIICVVDINKAKLSPKYAPEELEWKIHSAAVMVNKKEDLQAAVESALNKEPTPEIMIEKNRWRQYLFDDMTDGRAGERIAARLCELLKAIGK
jgi:CDP-glycerol glycerophosphotransferase (TagB/SpsB family)